MGTAVTDTEQATTTPDELADFDALTGRYQR